MSRVEVRRRCLTPTHGAIGFLKLTCVNIGMSLRVDCTKGQSVREFIYSCVILNEKIPRS